MMPRKSKEFKPGVGGKRAHYNLEEEDLERLSRIKKHIKKLGIPDTDTAAVKRAIYFYDNYIEKGITVE